MEYTETLYDVSDNVATITLNRPDKLNAWTGTMERQYRHALADAEGRDDVRVIILTGAGRGFCAGADMNHLADISQGGQSGSSASSALALVSSINTSVRSGSSVERSFTVSLASEIAARIRPRSVWLV